MHVGVSDHDAKGVEFGNAVGRRRREPAGVFEVMGGVAPRAQSSIQEGGCERAQRDDAASSALRRAVKAFDFEEETVPCLEHAAWGGFPACVREGGGGHVLGDQQVRPATPERRVEGRAELHDDRAALTGIGRYGRRELGVLAARGGTHVVAGEGCCCVVWVTQPSVGTSARQKRSADPGSSG